MKGCLIPLVALLILIGVSGAVSAATVSVSAPSVYPANKDVTVTIRVSDVQDLAYFKVILNYDKSRLDYQSYTVGSAFSDWGTFNVNVDEGSGKIEITGDVGDGTPVTGDAVLIQLKFTTTATGDAEFSFDTANSYLQDIGYLDIETTWQGATMTIGKPAIKAYVPQTVSNGNYYTIEVKGEYLYDIAAFKFVVDYDDSKLNIENPDNDVTLGDDLSGWNIKPQVIDESGNKKLKVIAYCPYDGGLQTFTGSATLFKIKFKAIADGKPDWSSFFSDVELSDSNAEDATPTTQQTITYTIGDVNGDGNTDILDLVALIKLIINGQYDPKADLDADGDVDSNDLSALINQL